MTQALTLVVDDEPAICDLLAITLRRMGVESEAVTTLTEARERLNRRAYDLCLTDMRLPDGDGLELVAHIQNRFPNTPVAVITAHGNMESAIQALKSGAFDFVTKPVDLAVLKRLVSTAIKLSEKKQEGQRGPQLIGESPSWRAARRRCTSAAKRAPARNWWHA